MICLITSCKSNPKPQETIVSNDCLIISKPYFPAVKELSCLSRTLKEDILAKNILYCKRCGNSQETYKDYCKELIKKINE